jgi:transposase
MALKLDELFPDTTEEQVVKMIHDLYMAGKSTKELGEVLDVTDVTIRKYFKKYNLSMKRHGGQYTGKHVQISEEEYKSTPAKDLMKKYDISQFTYYQLTKQYPSRVGRSKKYDKTRG